MNNDDSSYTNHAVTNYTGGSRFEDAFSEIDSEMADYDPSQLGFPQSQGDFYEDQPLNLDEDGISPTKNASNNHGLYHTGDNTNYGSEFRNRDSSLDHANQGVGDDFYTNDENQEEQDDWKVLARWLNNELGAPEILQYRKAELENLSELLEFQNGRIEELRNSGDYQKSFESMILQTDVERTKYLIRSYLRARIQKIENNLMWYATVTEASKNLSVYELEYAKGLANATKKYYNNAFLGNMPQSLQAVDGVDLEGLSLVTEPNYNSAVFCRILKDVGEYQLTTSGDVIQMEKNNIFITSYKNVSGLIVSGNAQLL
ncbi:hypothetical protein BB559_001000 [Furculomyces boomerangus]|uniref:DNA replication complex GINS protein SLD5 n=2 Tax=Harpellales TaxID=61421 RepID=A0A2T9Z3D6_9FUNG|nr:hypothetical protein BB559_004499 [Furculomyces boomerangus]PVU99105.1 hypothetical protein BB559_001000 [Furculomyces boomerangus]PVZ97066.1 hypothetical protein BB558_006999 [Smittium angustum]